MFKNVILNMGEKIRRLFYYNRKCIETDKKYNYKCQRECSAPNSMVTQGITYPFCVVKINSKKRNYKKSHSFYFFCTNSLILELVLKT
jgi:hypothetical protein